MNPVWHFLNGVPVIPVARIGTNLAGDGTASAPSYSFASAPTTGWYHSSGLLASLSGADRFGINGSGVVIASGELLVWGSSGLATPDVSLSRLAAGSWASSGPNGSATNVRKATTSLTTNSGTGTATATNLIPAGSLVIGIDARITTVIAGAGMTTFSIGDGSDVDRWGTGILLAAGTTVTLTDATITTAPIYAAAASVVLTANAGQFDSGVIRLTVHYLSITAATS